MAVAKVKAGYSLEMGTEGTGRRGGKGQVIRKGFIWLSHSIPLLPLFSLSLSLALVLSYTLDIL